MSKEKQIEEMIKIAFPIYQGMPPDKLKAAISKNFATFTAIENIYNANYRRQSEGEWIEHTYGELKCSECGIVQEDYPHRYNYCPNCGAQMKGGAE